MSLIFAGDNYFNINCNWPHLIYLQVSGTRHFTHDTEEQFGFVWKLGPLCFLEHRYSYQNNYMEMTGLKDLRQSLIYNTWMEIVLASTDNSM